MKKALVIILASALIMTGFAGCGNSADSGQSAVSEAKEVSAEGSSAAENNAAAETPEETAAMESGSEHNDEAANGAVENAESETSAGEADAAESGKAKNPGSMPSDVSGGPGKDPDDGSTENQGPGGTPPDGANGNGGPGGTPPDGANGNGGPGGTPPDGANGNGGPGGTPPGGFGGNGGPGGGSAADVNYTAATEISEAGTQSGQTYESTTADESALLISTTGEVTIENASVTKTGDSDGGDNCNFYGLNAAVLAKDGANVTISGSTITSDADGANGVFSYGGNGGQNGADGDGTTVTIRDTEITTTGDGSGGIMTTGGGTMYAYDLSVETSGRSSAAIRTDRGGGTVIADGGTYVSNGLGSPAIYSTADITVKNASLTSNLSEGVCIEGKNSITLENCTLTANNTKCNGNATFYDTIMIYQSMSGDADSGTSSFTMNGGTLTSLNGHMFHVTNTNAVISLTGVTLVNEDEENVLLSVCADGWSGAGNIATLNVKQQKLFGSILVGSDSELTLSLNDGSSFEGAISGSITNAKGESVSEEVGTVSVILDESSTWTLTADTYITSFEGNAENVITNGYTLYVDGSALAGTRS